MYGECKGSQDKKIVMISIRKGPWERRCGMKGQDEEKSTAQEENHNTYSISKKSNCNSGSKNKPLPKPSGLSIRRRQNQRGEDKIAERFVR